MSGSVRQRLQPALALLLILQVAAAPSYSAPAADSDQSGRRVSISIGKVRQEIKSHQDKILQSDEQAVNVLDEMEEIDRKLSLQKEKMISLQQQLQNQDALLEQKDEELKIAEAERDRMLLHLQKRLQSFYLMGKTGLLNVTFSNKDLPELMLFTDSFKQLVSYDRSVIDVYRVSVTRLQLARQAQVLEKSIMEGFVQQAEEEEQSLYALRGEKEALIEKIRTQKGLYKLAVQEMRKAESDLSKMLAGIKQQEAKKKQGFLLSRGMLPPPVKGTLLNGFEEVIDEGLRKGEQAKGITIQTGDGAPVQAVYKGKVRFAGYQRGFGKMIIIDHGAQHFTVTARLDSILVKQEEQVGQGTQIGTTGGMATLFEGGLYFEIRRESTPLDPIQWLRSGSLALRPKTTGE